jgi:hypothetical protein
MSGPRGRTNTGVGSLHHPGDKSSRAVEDERMPARPPWGCDHGYLFSKCSICKRAWDEKMGYTAPRL